jgi:hypothetical protein
MITICRLQHTAWHMTMCIIQIEQGIIMVCTPDLYYQEFIVNGPELRRAKHRFLKRLDMYHDLIFDEKEKTTPMKEEDFNAR